MPFDTPNIRAWQWLKVVEEASGSQKDRRTLKFKSLVGCLRELGKTRWRKLKKC